MNRSEAMRSKAVVEGYFTRAEMRARKRAFKRKQAIERFIVTMVVAVGMVVFLTFIFSSLYQGLVENSHKYDYTETTQVVVHQGDTLWVIAQDYCDERHDIRAVIDEIEGLSNTTANLQIGQVLTVPLYDCLLSE